MDELDIIFWSYVVVVIALPIIVTTFLFPLREHPKLDWAFIWGKASLSIIAAFYLTIRWDWVDRHSLAAIRIAMVLWIDAALSQLFVLYCIYDERFRGRIIPALWRLGHAISRFAHSALKWKPSWHKAGRQRKPVHYRSRDS